MNEYWGITPVSQICYCLSDYPEMFWDIEHYPESGDDYPANNAPLHSSVNYSQYFGCN